MELLGIQIIGILFAFLMIYVSFLNYKRKQFTIKELLFWIVFYMLLLIVTISPNILDPFVKNVLNLSRPLDFFIIAGFLFLTGAIFYTYTIVRRIQSKLEDLIRKIAIDNNTRKKK